MFSRADPFPFNTPAGKAPEARLYGTVNCSLACRLSLHLQSPESSAGWVCAAAHVAPSSCCSRESKSKAYLVAAEDSTTARQSKAGRSRPQTRAPGNAHVRSLRPSVDGRIATAHSDKIAWASTDFAQLKSEAVAALLRVGGCL